MKFYDELINNFTAHRTKNNDRFASIMLEYLEREGLQRITFDSEQAVKFVNIDNEPNSEIQSMIKLPFDNFYLEFTEQIELGLNSSLSNQEEINNICRSFVLLSTGTITLAKYKNQLINPIHQVVMYFTTPEWNRPNETGFVDTRAFLLDINTGYPATTINSIRDGSPEDAHLFDDYDDNDYVLLDDAIDWQGNWSQNMKTYSSLIHWILLYMMAKGIGLEKEYLSRQHKRQMERMNIPNPWHKLKVDPQFSDENQQSTNNPQYKHKIRYDVTGYLRFGKHKLKDGTYKRTIEWVRPHQRGLKNKLYVPKTSHVVANKQIDPRMNEYFSLVKES